MEQEIKDIFLEIQRKNIPNNFDRAKAGNGRSQTFGLQRRWSYRPWLSRNTWMRPELWQMIQTFAERNVTIEWTACTVNSDYKSAPHRDKGNEGPTWIMAFGDYTGGELVVEGVEHDIRYKPLLFNGALETHYTKSWIGHRYSLVFYNIIWPTKFLPRYSVTSHFTSEGTVISDMYDCSMIVLNRKGHVVRIIHPGLPREWIGKITSRGQPSRVAPGTLNPTLPAFLPSSPESEIS